MELQKDMLTGKEICSLLGISRRTLTRLARARLLPGLVRVGRRLKMHREVLEAYRRGDASATELRRSRVRAAVASAGRNSL